MNDRDQTGHSWTAVLRRQPVRIVEGWAEGGYTDTYEPVCCNCGDHLGLDYREVPAELQRTRGPYRFAEGIAAYLRHVQRYHGQRANHQPGHATRSQYRLARLDDPFSATVAWLAETVRRQI